jgi:SAM-dependent methyltransferase
MDEFRRTGMIVNTGQDLRLRLTPEELKEVSDRAFANIKSYDTIIKKMSYLERFFDGNYTDKHTVHSYLPEYERILQPFIKNQTAFKMLEVGIQRGGSIAGWLQAFPSAKVFGADCQKTVNITHPNYTELITNAYDTDFLDKVSKDFDFIIDDGSHAYNDILFACEHYPKLLKKGGILVIEDIPDVTWIPKMRAMATKAGCIGEVRDLRDKKNRWDDVMLVFKKV